MTFFSASSAGWRGEQALIFVRTRLRADELAAWLTEKGIGADALHGDMRQYIRQKVLRRFKKGELRLLVATDVAARGIDVSGLGLVVNYDLPEMVESYVHRIGRTGRAGRDGEALSICSVADQEKLSAILAHVGQRLVIVDGDGNEVTDFQPEIAPRKGRGRGRPPRRFRDGKPGGKPGGRPGGKFGGKPGGKPGGKSGGKFGASFAGSPSPRTGTPTSVLASPVASRAAIRPESRHQGEGGCRAARRQALQGAGGRNAAVAGRTGRGMRDGGAPRAARPGKGARKPDPIESRAQAGQQARGRA